MVRCKMCGSEVTDSLRSTAPKCPRGHSLGEWVNCENKHVYLRPTEGPPCPVCNDRSVYVIVPGTLVKCIELMPNGNPCNCPKFPFPNWPCCNGHYGRVRKDP